MRAPGTHSLLMPTGDQEIIRRVLDVRDAKLEYVDGGWDSHVYLFNKGQAVFKFPRSSQAKLQYEREVHILDALETVRLPVLIPHVEWRGPDLEWFGYRGIIGQSLDAALPHLDGHCKAAVGRKLGGFLRELHTQRVDDLPNTTVEEEIARYQHKYRLSLAALERLIATDQATIARFFLNTLPARLRSLNGELRLSHGDLGPWNIILTDRGEVGVIDFGDASCQDPSIDFSGFGDDLIREAALAEYGADNRLRAGAALREAALPIAEVSHYLAQGDDLRVQVCLDHMRHLIYQLLRTPS